MIRLLKWWARAPSRGFGASWSFNKITKSTQICAHMCNMKKKYFFVGPLRGQESFLRPPPGTSELFWVKSVEFCKNRVSATIPDTLPSTFASGDFALFSIFLKSRFLARLWICVPDVRRYLSTFWGALLMLLKWFDYLSDGHASLVEDLRPPEVSSGSYFYSFFYYWKSRENMVKNALNFVFSPNFSSTKGLWTHKLTRRHI